ncbi:MAG: hypothetical protein WDA16_09690 [Candidatus Thermoplasmatota archaeon]
MGVLFNMRVLVLLAVVTLSLTMIGLAPASDATAFCTNATSNSCRALVCLPNTSGGQVCSKDLSPVCIREPCPGLP